MALSAGARLGPYEVTAHIGSGGMGDVYRARDTRLKREVAIKILPESFAADPERLARFQREAEVLASLNHPNITHIHGFEEAPGIQALVMELVEGPTLADRVANGPFPLDDAVAIAKQIADALEAAHEQGIIHRDLKPANIKVRLDGTVKVLDFGLAKALEGPTRLADISQLPTVSVEATSAGVILGTAPYMSPEQAKGKAVDTRADVWAFGCVLYEMLTARSAFGHETLADTLAAVLERDPAWSALPTSTPTAIRRLLERCLNKDPKRRLRDIGDARIELDDARTSLESGKDKIEIGRVAAEAGSKLAVAPSRRPVFWIVTAAALAVVAGISVAGWWRATRSVSQPALRFPVDLGPEAADPINGAGAILSPDGTRAVYRVRDASRTVQLFTRTLDQEQPTPLAGTDDAIGPFFSPDGQSVGFFDTARSKLKKIFLEQGSLMELCDAPFARGGSWGEDGNIIAGITARGPLYRIPSGGGTPQPITDLKQAVTHRWPQVLPGAQAVVFTANDFIGNFDQATIEIQSLTTGERKTLVRGGYYGRYVPTGDLLYVRNGTLYAAPLDVKRQELTGPPVPVIKSVRNRISSGGAAFDISRNGTLIYAEGVPVKFRLAWLDSSGHLEWLAARASQYIYRIRFSPDGKRLALVTGEAGSLDVWVYEWQRDAWARLTSSPDVDSYPVWSPDGTHIAFMALAPSEEGILWKRADGTGESVKLTAGKAAAPFSFSPNGNYLAFTETDPLTKDDVWLLPLEDVQSDHPQVKDRVPLLKTGFNERAPMISPDGRWLAYQSDESGRDEVYVQAFPKGGGKWPVSTGGGSTPVWARNGQQLFYRSPAGMMVVSYRINGAVFEPGGPRVWAAKSDLGEWFDLSPDGKRFVTIASAADDSESTPVIFVLNFFDELKALASAR